MKKYLLAFLVVSACTPAARIPAPAPAPGGGNQMTGATTARAAVEQFLNAVRAEDIQAMSVNFGTSKGPARDNMERDELEKRLVILQCFFNHDKFRILGDALGDAGHRIISAELTRGGQSRSPRFYVIAGPGRRWYVDNMEIAVVRDFCRDAPR